MAQDPQRQLEVGRQVCSTVLALDPSSPVSPGQNETPTPLMPLSLAEKYVFKNPYQGIKRNLLRFNEPPVLKEQKSKQHTILA